jgi:hypothetical protein
MSLVLSWFCGDRQRGVGAPFVESRIQSCPTSVAPHPHERLRVSFALQGYYGRVQPAIENLNPGTFKFQVQGSGMTTKEGAGGADVLVQSRFVVLLAEGYSRRTTPAPPCR